MLQLRVTGRIFHVFGEGLKCNKTFTIFFLLLDSTWNASIQFEFGCRVHFPQPSEIRKTVCMAFDGDWWSFLRNGTLEFRLWKMKRYDWMGRLKIFHCRQKTTWAFTCTVIMTVTETVYVNWDRVCLFISGHTILAMCIELLGDELTTPKVRAKAKFSTLYKVWSLTIKTKKSGNFYQNSGPV